MENIILIGSNGFLGRRILNLGTEPGLKFLKVENSEKLFSTLGQLSTIDSPTTFIWAAAKVNPVSAEKSLDEVEQEFETFRNFIISLSRYESIVRNIIFLSSAGCLYSGESNTFSEHDVALGTNRYGKLKRSMEDLLTQSSLHHTILRISNIYGPGQRTGRGQGVIGEWVKAIRSNQPITIYGDGRATRDYIFVSDVVSAIGKVLARPLGGVYNLGYGKSYSLLDVLSKIKDITPLAIETNFLPRRSIDREYFALDVQEFQNSFGWKPKYDLTLGLSLTFSDLDWNLSESGISK